MFIVTFDESEEEGSRRGSHGFNSLNLQLRACDNLLCLEIEVGVCDWGCRVGSNKMIKQ